MLEQARVARLGFVDEADHPRVLPVTFVLLDEMLYSAIDRKPKRASAPARIRYLRRRSEAALTVDRYEDDWDSLAWVQVLGRVEVLEAEHAGEALAALCSKYGQYRDEPPPGPLLRL